MFEEFVLTASTADLSEEPQAREHADAVEFRMDLASDPLAQLDTYDGELPLLVTNRASWEGRGRRPRTVRRAHNRAHPRRSRRRRHRACRPPRERTEGEESHATALRNTARETDVAVVVSVHDFESTPEPAALVDLLADAPPPAAWESWRRPRPRPRTRSR